MYEIGQYIIYGCEGVCRVEEIGPVEIKGAQKGVEYYTLASVYQQGKIYVPVDSHAYSRPIMTRQEAEALIADIPNIPTEIYENNNPRLLGEHYQTYLKSNDCRELLKLIRAIHAKRQMVAAKGRRLGQVDERSYKQAEDKLHGELAVSLELSVNDVRQYIVNALEKVEQTGR